MAILFRNTDSSWGVGKGAPLTSLEVDQNFFELLMRVAGLEDNPPEAASISNFQVIGSQLKIFLTNGDEFGPYTLPIAAFQFRGEWALNTEYFELDIFEVPDVGLFMVRVDHVTPESGEFDPNAVSEDSEHTALYLQLFGAPSGSGTVGSEYYAIMHRAFGGI